MGHDEDLAARVRDLLPGAVEKRMFGGMGFLVGGHMPVCVGGGGGLLVRVPEAEGERLVAGHEHVAWMSMGQRTARTWVDVAALALADDAELAAWVERGLAVVRTLPPKG